MEFDARKISHPTRFTVECIWTFESTGGISHVACGEAAGAIRLMIRRSFDAGTTIDNDSIAGIERIINESRIRAAFVLAGTR